MSYRDTIGTLSGNPEKLEHTYQDALRAGEADAFRTAVEAHHTAAPDNLLFAAWYHRLAYAADQAKSFAVAWGWVIPLALFNGLLLWWFSDPERYMISTRSIIAERSMLPTVFLLGTPIIAASLLVYLTGVGRRRPLLAGAIAAALFGGAGYVIWAYPQAGTHPFQEQYVTLMVFHLALLAWAGVGLYLVTGRWDGENRFAFLIKSIEIFVLGGLFAIACGVFTGITVGLFQALNVTFEEWAIRLFVGGAAGVVSVASVAIIYNPRVAPAAQNFDEGLSKLVALLPRILLPLALLVLLVYSAFIPFNFRAPFDNREVLIIYNGMLFAVVALLVGATPLPGSRLSPGVARALRWGIVAVAALALLISLYALTAIVYRTAIDRLTPNRLTFIGWNLVNILLLALILVLQLRAGMGDWRRALYRAYSAGTVLYAVWAALVLLALPWLFGVDDEAMAGLPVSIQVLVYERPAPILLKCDDSPHIYLLEDGEKRWIDTIATLEARGYTWRDVVNVTCSALQRVPDGPSIPEGVGPPPLP